MTSLSTIFSGLFFLNAVVFAFLCARYFFLRARFLKTAVRVSGTVSDNLQIERRAFGFFGKKTLLYQPRIAYEAPSGEKKFLISELARPRIKYEAGTPIPLFVDPMDPEDVIIDEFRSKWSFVTLLGAVAVASVLAGMSLSQSR